jgi:hypothetical protein
MSSVAEEMEAQESLNSMESHMLSDSLEKKIQILQPLMSASEIGRTPFWKNSG